MNHMVVNRAGVKSKRRHATNCLENLLQSYERRALVNNAPCQHGIYSPEKTSAAGPVMNTSFLPSHSISRSPPVR